MNRLSLVLEIFITTVLCIVVFIGLSLVTTELAQQQLSPATDFTLFVVATLVMGAVVLGFIASVQASIANHVTKPTTRVYDIIEKARRERNNYDREVAAWTAAARQRREVR